MAASRFFYHSFPRIRNSKEDEFTRAIQIIESVIDRGLLLTPERFDFHEELENGTLSNTMFVIQNRMSLTELEPSELIQHSKTFGSFSFEWAPDTLLQMGAIPVFYIPLKNIAGAHEALGCSMLARLCDIQKLLTRLDEMNKLVQQSSLSNHILDITNNGIPVAQTRCTVGGASDLLQMLQAEMQPIPILLGAVRGISNLFYPVDNEKYTEPLGYYRQREWRLVAGVIRLGKPVTVNVESDDINALLRIDNEFFAHEMDFSDGRRMRAVECQLYKTFRGAPIVQSIRKLICPRKAMQAVHETLKRKNIELDVVALEEYAAY